MNRKEYLTHCPKFQKLRSNRTSDCECLREYRPRIRCGRELLRKHDRRLETIPRAVDLELDRIAATEKRASALGEHGLELRGDLLLIFHRYVPVDGAVKAFDEIHFRLPA